MRSLTRRSVREQTHAALVGQQFADRTDTAAAQVIDIVQRAFALLELEQILGRGDEVILREDASVGLHAEFWLIL